MNWIMACVSSVSDAVMVNGFLNQQFGGGRGIRQGFPLSPYLFILAIEGLSSLIKEARINGKIKGIKVARALNITHLLFVDDVLLFGKGEVIEWAHFKDIISCFCLTTGMEVSTSKSSFLYQCKDFYALLQINFLCPYQMREIGEGLKYLGYFLKPNGYSVANWRWLIKKVHRRLNI